MSHLSMILSVLMTLAIVIYMAPGIFALNRGHILRNVALWLAIFLALGLFFKNFGPGSPHPLFNMPYAFEGMNKGEAVKLAPAASSDAKPEAAKPAERKSDEAKDNNDGEQGYTPPKEE